MTDHFTLLGLTGYTYGLWIAVGALLSLLLMGLLSHGRRLPAGTTAVFGVIAIPLGLFFARLIFCLLSLSLFVQTYENPLLMLRFFDGGFSMTGLIMGLTLAAFYASRALGLRFGQVLDVAAAPMALFIAFCRVGEGCTDLGIGKVVEPNFFTHTTPWLFISESMGIATEYRLAVYRCEAAAALVLCLLLLLLGRSLRRDKHVPAGDVGLMFFALYGASQMVLESLRDDGHMMITFLRVAQVAAFLMPVIATTVFAGRFARLKARIDSPHGLSGPIRVPGRVVLCWFLILLCLAGATLMEFSLDGRLTWGQPSLLRDYGILTALALLLFLAPYSLFHTLRSRLYAQGAILTPVHAQEDPRRL